MSEKTITVKEFRQWLSGVEEMQEDGWVPDAKQWAKIRAKINEVVEAEPAPTYAGVGATQGYRNQAPDQYSGPGPTSPGQMIPQSFEIPPTMLGGVPNPIMASGRPSMGGIQTTKTPDIDSSNGYNSAFA